MYIYIYKRKWDENLTRYVNYVLAINIIIIEVHWKDPVIPVTSKNVKEIQEISILYLLSS